jgi:hypothetical protein
MLHGRDFSINFCESLFYRERLRDFFTNVKIIRQKDLENPQFPEGKMPLISLIWCIDGFG